MISNCSLLYLCSLCLERVGGFRDGAKWVCDVELMAQTTSVMQPTAKDSANVNEIQFNNSIGESRKKSSVFSSTSNCLVYSFGSNGNFIFEKDLLSRYGCEIHIFDFDNFTSFSGMFSRASDRSLVHFHNW